MSAPYDARAVANAILDLAATDNRPITILKLLKILYFAHGWYLVSRERALVRNSFEAWEFGPVLPTVYRAFEGIGDRPINSRALLFNTAQERWEAAQADFDDFDADFINWIYVSYCKYDAFELSGLTHAPDSPWTRVWEEGTRGIVPGMRINDDEIRLYFNAIKQSHMNRA